MFRARNLTILFVGLIVVGIFWRITQAWIPPNPYRFAADSYSARLVGHRALYELLNAFGVPVERAKGVPMTGFHGSRRVLLLEPDFVRLELERDYINHVANWVRSGGELVVTSNHFTWRDTDMDYRLFSDLDEILGNDMFLTRLGIADLALTEIEYSAVSPKIPDEPWGYFMEDMLFGTGQPEKVYWVQASGSLEHLQGAAEHVKLPDLVLRGFVGRSVEGAVGKVEVESDDTSYTIALEFPCGAGTVTLVSAPTLFKNLGIGSEDNAVLAFYLAVGENERPVVLDEYYHGMTVQANPFALLGIYPYGFIAVSVLLATLLWVWSNVVRFGPPVKKRTESRRNIREYIDAMARVFLRGQEQRFVLATCRDGLIEEVREALYLAPGTGQALILRRLTLSDPERGTRLRGILEEINRILASHRPVENAALAELQERLESCRTSTSQHPLNHHPSMSPRSTVRLRPR